MSLSKRPRRHLKGNGENNLSLMKKQVLIALLVLALILFYYYLNRKGAVQPPIAPVGVAGEKEAGASFQLEAPPNNPLPKQPGDGDRTGEGEADGKAPH